VNVTIAVIARVPAAGRADFLAYEDAVLPLLERHGGVLERRLRTGDGLTEVHVVSFPSPEAFAAYRGDPDRVAQQHLLERSGAAMELLEVSDVGPATERQG
jgi:hypothetical protein